MDKHRKASQNDWEHCNCILYDMDIRMYDGILLLHEPQNVYIVIAYVTLQLVMDTGTT